MSKLLLFAAGALSLAIVGTTATAEAQQVKYQMTTGIPVSITTPDSVKTSLGTLRFFDGFPAAATVQKVYDNLDFQRGVQAFLTALPAALLYAMRTSFRTAGPDNQTVLISESLLDSRTLQLTPEYRDRLRRRIARHEGCPTGHRSAAARARHDC